MKKIVYIVHAIDTEGPLYESTKATFERLESTFGIKLNPTYDNLQKLRNEEIKLNDRRKYTGKNTSFFYSFIIS